MNTPNKEQIAREAAASILEIPVLNQYMIPEMADIILAAIDKVTEDAYDAGYIAACRADPQPQPRKPEQSSDNMSPEAAPVRCRVRGESSRICELGTKSCVVSHAKEFKATPRGERSAERKYLCVCGRPDYIHYIDEHQGAANSEPLKEERGEPQEQDLKFLAIDCCQIVHNSSTNAEAADAIYERINAALAAEREVSSTLGVMNDQLVKELAAVRDLRLASVKDGK